MADDFRPAIVTHPRPSTRIDLPFVKRVSLAAGVFGRIIKGKKTTISEVADSTWMSPLQPLVPLVPGVAGRQYDYPVGYNINYQPRGYGSGLRSFGQLRMLSLNCEIFRLCLKNRKAQIAAQSWNIGFKDKKKKDDGDPRIAAITEFLQRPDKIHDWDDWTGALIEEIHVTDALSIYRAKTRGGQPYALELVDGSTIFPFIDDDGRRPMPPSPAYQQILKGMPACDYTTEELLYAPRETRVYTPYGYSTAEQIIKSCEMDIQRARYQLAYFTEGSLPDAYAQVPEGMTQDQITAFEDRFNGILAGNAGARRQVPFVPAGTELKGLKEENPLKDDFDEWITRKVCYGFGVPPTPFIKQMNRATSETSKDMAAEEGLEPDMKFLKKTLDYIIALDFNSPDLELNWVDDKEMDPAVSSTIAKDKVSTGQWTLNEARARDGLEPVQGGDIPMVLTPSGYVPLDAFEIQQQTQKDNLKATLDAKAQQNVGSVLETQGDAGAGNKDDKTKGKNKTGVGKAVSHPALPFDRPAIRQAIRALTKKIEPALKSTEASVVEQIKSSLQKIAKDDQASTDEATRIAFSLDLSTLDILATEIPDDLAGIMSDAGAQSLFQIGVTNRSALVNQVDKLSLDYANDRAAELVGKKWVNGVIVDNPNAEWAITDTTRNELKSIIADAINGKIKLKDLNARIAEAGTFSAERADMIGRTEIAMANGQGSLQSYRVARDAGVNLKKEWLQDANACPICVENGEAGAIELEEEFPSGDDTSPAHPYCECAISPVVIHDDE